MKKVYVLLLFVALSGVTFGQGFIVEDFSSGMMPPAGWSIDGLPAQWSVSATNDAGGEVPEAKFTYVSGTYVTRLISYEMDLTGLTEVQLTFRHFYDDYTGTGPKAGVATRSHNGAWNIVWEISPTSNVGPEQIDLTINNSDVGESEFQICFYLDGNMYNIDYWYLDDILLLNQLNLDASMTSITTPTYINGPEDVTGQIMNIGITTITSFDIDWQVNNGPIQSTFIDGLSIDALDTYNFTCDQQISVPIGTYTLNVWINKVNGVKDDDQSGDSLSKPLIRVSNVIPKKPCYEEFTSSTCAPCANFNAGFVPWCFTNEDDITLIKYQMSWPAPGDPYYTEEGGVRRTFYGVNGVPNLFCNGSDVPTTMTAVQSSFNAAVLQPGLMDIVASHHLNGTEMSVDVAVLPFADFTGMMLQVIVFEYITTGNVMTNGETEFEHVMMKMMPDANGTTINLEDRVTFSWSDQEDLAGTNVEEWDDLGVIVFVQDPASKIIYQSVYSLEDATYNTEARLDELFVDGIAMAGFDPDVFNYDVEVSGGVLIPEITGDPMDPNATVIVVPAIEVPGTTTIDVFAEDLTAHSLYEIDLIFAVGQDEKSNEAMRVYPNPTTGTIYIMGAEHARVSLYSPSGTLVKFVEDFNGSSFNIPDVSNGVYMLRVERTNGTVIQKKIVVVK